MTVRQATEADLTAIVQLSDRHREQLEALEPLFWRRHANANEAQASWFSILLADDAHQVLVSTNDDDAIEGFVIARAMDAPPVYDPGGSTCMVDDFVWTTAEAAESLLASARHWASSRECTQLIVVTPAVDTERRALLDRIGLHPTSEWWTGPI